MKCASCDNDLIPDSNTKYAFDNALWLGFYGGYAMFCDNLDAKLPTNSNDRWVTDDEGNYLLTEDGQPIDDETWEPHYAEPRLLPGHPDYECVICHDCAHFLFDSHPWLKRVFDPYNTHSHTDEYHRKFPYHDGWDHEHWRQRELKKEQLKGE